MDANAYVDALLHSERIVRLAHYDHGYCDGRGRAVMLDPANQIALMCQECGFADISRGAVVRFATHGHSEPTIVGEPLPVESVHGLELCRLEYSHTNGRRDACRAIVIDSTQKIAVAIENCGQVDKTLVAAGAFVKYSGSSSEWPRIDGHPAYAHPILIGKVKFRTAG